MVKHSYNRTQVIVVAASISVVAACIALALPPAPGQWAAIRRVAAGDAGLLASMLFLGMVRVFARCERLKVTDEGLRGRRFGVPHMVRQPKAWLFVRAEDANAFALADPTSSVRFSYLEDQESQRGSRVAERIKSRGSRPYPSRSSVQCCPQSSHPSRSKPRYR